MVGDFGGFVVEGVEKSLIDSSEGKTISKRFENMDPVREFA